jgi:hypothetical protein
LKKVSDREKNQKNFRKDFTKSIFFPSGNSFLKKMTQDKKYSAGNEWECDESDDFKADPEGMIHGIIHCEDIRSKSSPKDHKHDPSNQLPFPGSEKEKGQDYGRDGMHHERKQLLRKRQRWTKRIHCKQLYEQNCEDTDDPGKPVKEADSFHVCRIRK